MDPRIEAFKRQRADTPNAFQPGKVVTYESGAAGMSGTDRHRVFSRGNGQGVSPASLENFFAKQANPEGITAGSTSKPANREITFAVISVDGTTESPESLEFQPVFGMRLNQSFDPNDPFVRVASKVQSAASMYNTGVASLPRLRVITVAEKNYMTSLERVGSNVGPDGNPRNATDTNNHLGIFFLGWVKAADPYVQGKPRMMSILTKGYGMIGFPATISTENRPKVWIVEGRFSDAVRSKYFLDGDFVVGGTSTPIARPRSTASVKYVVNPVQTVFYVGERLPYELFKSETAEGFSINSVTLVASISLVTRPQDADVNPFVFLRVGNNGRKFPRVQAMIEVKVTGTSF